MPISPNKPLSRGNKKMDGIVFMLNLSASRLPSKHKLEQSVAFTLSLLFTDQEAVIGCSPMVQHTEVDPPDGRCEAPNAACAG